MDTLSRLFDCRGHRRYSHLEAVAQNLARRLPQMLSINAWNEWTEGSYLEPDTQWGMAYLEAVRDVLGG